MEPIDPLLLKGIRLCHSTAKDSAQKLRAMILDLIEQRKAQLKITGSSKAESSRADYEKSEKIADKRSIDKVLKAKLESSEVPIEKKRFKLEDSIPKSRSLTSSPNPDSRPIVVVKSEPLDTFELSKGTKTNVINVKVEDDSEATDIEETEGETSKDADEFDLDDGLGDISCVVCKDFNSSYNNQLVECQECHQLYHQECHKPPATKEDISDPRSIWYCSRCTKTMKKNAGKSSKSSAVSTKPAATTASSAFEKAINMGKESALLLVKEKMKTERKDVPVSPSPFKRSASESKSSTSAAASVAKPIGLAGLAANLNKPSAASASAPSSSSTSPLISKSKKPGKVDPVKKKSK